MRVLELFGGIGACSKALSNLNVEHTIVDYVEIDKYAVKSFNAIHKTNFEPQDIRTYDKDIECDLIMHGSPCQDFSLAGKQKGGDKDSGTRSSLLYETIRIVAKVKPKYVIWENVKNVISKKHRHNFDDYLEEMSKLGYTNYYQVLNAKDYGIPQNRERVFTISILPTIEVDKTIKPSVFKNFDREKENILKSDKDIYQCECSSGWQDNKVGIKVSPCIRANNNNTFILDDNRKFTFPPKQELKLKLKDMLESEVDEKYYLNDVAINKIQNSNFMQERKRIQEKDFCDTLLSRDYKDPKCIQIKEATKQGVVTIGNYMSSNHNASRVVDSDYVAPTVMENHGTITATNTHDLRIRKLTPKECWRLMGFSDDDFDKASKVNSNSQLYKQAGNSIVVNVLMAIFKEMIGE